MSRAAAPRTAAPRTAAPRTADDYLELARIEIEGTSPDKWQKVLEYTTKAKEIDRKKGIKNGMAIAGRGRSLQKLNFIFDAIQEFTSLNRVPKNGTLYQRVLPNIADLKVLYYGGPNVRPETKQWMDQVLTARLAGDWKAMISPATKAIELEKRSGNFFVRGYAERGRAYDELRNTNPGYRDFALADYQSIEKWATEDGKWAKKRLRELGDTAQPVPNPDPPIIGDRGETPTPTPIPTPPNPNRLPDDMPLPAFVSPLIDSKQWLASLAAGRVSITKSAHKQNITALAVSPMGQQVATGSWGREIGGDTGEIQWWKGGFNIAFQPGSVSKSQMNQDNTFVGHYGNTCALAYSPGGEILASGGSSGGITLWDAASGKAMRVLRDEKRMKLDSKNRIIALGWRGQGADLILTAVDNTGLVLTWQRSGNEMSPTKTLKLIRRENSPDVKAAIFVADGQRIAIGNADGYVEIYDITTGRLTDKIDNDDLDPSAKTLVEITALAASPNGILLAHANHGHVYVTFAKPSDNEKPYLSKRFLDRVLVTETVEAMAWLSNDILLVRTGKKVMLVEPGKLLSPDAIEKDALMGSVDVPGCLPGTNARLMVAPIPGRAAVMEAVVAEMTGVRILEGVSSTQPSPN